MRYEGRLPKWAHLYNPGCNRYLNSISLWIKDQVYENLPKIAVNSNKS